MLRFLEEDTLVGTIVSSIGTMLSIGLNLTPIILFYNFFRKNASLNTIPETMFISGIFCCATNLAYGIIQDNQILKISNGVCYGLQIFYATIYIFIKAHKQIEKLLLYLLIAWDLSFQALYIFGNRINSLLQVSSLPLINAILSPFLVSIIFIFSTKIKTSTCLSKYFSTVFSGIQ